MKEAFCYSAISTSALAKTAALPSPSNTFAASASLTPVPPSSPFTRSTRPTSLLAGGAASGELTLFARLLGAAARLPACPAAQPGRLPRLLPVAARLRRRHRGHHHRFLPPHAAGIFFAAGGPGPSRLRRGLPGNCGRRWLP